MSPALDTIAALATPGGTSALALIRVSGNDSRALAEALLGQEPTPRGARHFDYRDLRGGLVDDVIGIFYAGPRSYTGEDSLEITCHGNPLIVQKLLEDLFARGCRPAAPGEFTQRAFLNGRLELSQAEAVMDVISARSERALAAAHQQLRGSLAVQMNALTDGLLAVLAHVEAYIDFPDEDLPAEDRAGLAEAMRALQADTGRLLATSHYGALLRDGIKTVILGAPNAGKSSILNRLVGHDRALVSAEPGTTRDYLEERVMMGAHGLRLIDTAGLNPAPGTLEARGIEKTHELAAAADLLLYIVDGSQPFAWGETPLPRMQKSTTIVVLNKSDLTPGTGPGASGIPADWVVVRVSALTGDGWGALRSAIVAMADRWQIEAGADEIAISARHAAALQEAQASLSSAREKLDANAPAELLASDLRGALAAYGEISGKVDNERMLDQLFASFCIGK